MQEKAQIVEQTIPDRPRLPWPASEVKVKCLVIGRGHNKLAVALGGPDGKRIFVSPYSMTNSCRVVKEGVKVPGLLVLAVRTLIKAKIELDGFGEEIRRLLAG